MSQFPNFTITTTSNSCIEGCETSNNDFHKEKWPYILYLVQSILFGIGNSLIVATVIKHPHLRIKKEYVMVALLAFADVINEIGFFWGGCHRIYLIRNGIAFECVSPYYCIVLPQGILWSFSFPLVYYMLLAVSIDRVICVLRPLTYKTFSLKFTFLLAAFFYVLAGINSAVTIVESYQYSHNPEQPCSKTYEALCLFDHNLGYNASYYLSTGIQVACSAASVVLYASIPFIYRRQVRKLSKLPFSAELNFLREQSRLLVTLGIGAVFTFLLMVLMGIFRMLTHAKLIPMEPFPWAGLIMNMNPVVNTFLFIFRHQRFRASFLALITCRKQVDDFEQLSFFRNTSVFSMQQNQTHSMQMQPIQIREAALANGRAT